MLGFPWTSPEPFCVLCGSPRSPSLPFLFFLDSLVSSLSFSLSLFFSPPFFTSSTSFLVISYPTREALTLAHALSGILFFNSCTPSSCFLSNRIPNRLLFCDVDLMYVLARSTPSLAISYAPSVLFAPPPPLSLVFEDHGTVMWFRTSCHQVHYPGIMRLS